MGFHKIMWIVSYNTPKSKMVHGRVSYMKARHPGPNAKNMVSVQSIHLFSLSYHLTFRNTTILCHQIMRQHCKFVNLSLDASFSSHSAMLHFGLRCISQAIQTILTSSFRSVKVKPIGAKPYTARVTISTTNCTKDTQYVK